MYYTEESFMGRNRGEIQLFFSRKQNIRLGELIIIVMKCIDQYIDLRLLWGFGIFEQTDYALMNPFATRKEKINSVSLN